MEEDKVLDIFGPVQDHSKDIIKVIGVGGGGCNAVNNMYREKIVNVSFAVCNTDSQSLQKSPVPVKIQLGKSGLGAGANPELGRSEAEHTREQIKHLFDDNTKMCFITAGMGGGTGTGAAPVIAGIARSKGILTIGIVTIPFFFEKKNKIVKALKGVEEMRKNVDSLLIINNERLCDIYADANITIKEAFRQADRILSDATKSISELITVEGNINLDFRDVETTMQGGGGALMAIGRAKGERRVQKAILNALNSPLLYGSDISKAKKILFNIYTSDESPLLVHEMQEVDAFMYELDPSIDVIWGTSDDNSLGEDAKVVILATGLDNQFMPKEEVHIDNDKVYYDQIINKLYREGGFERISGRSNCNLMEEAAAAPGIPLTVNSTKDEKMAETVQDAETSPATIQNESKDTEQTESSNPSHTDPSDDTLSKEPIVKTNGNTTEDTGNTVADRPLSFTERVRERIKRSLLEFTSDIQEN